MQWAAWLGALLTSAHHRAYQANWTAVVFLFPPPPPGAANRRRRVPSAANRVKFLQMIFPWSDLSRLEITLRFTKWLIKIEDKVRKIIETLGPFRRWGGRLRGRMSTNV